MVTSFLKNNKDIYKYKDIFVPRWCCNIARYVLQSAMYKTSLDPPPSRSQGFALCACDSMSLTIPLPRALYVAIDGYLFWNFGMVVASYRATPTHGTRACEYDLWRTQLNFLLLCIFSLSPLHPIKPLLFRYKPHPMAMILHSPSQCQSCHATNRAMTHVPGVEC
jgi:hypothetical protein